MPLKIALAQMNFLVSECAGYRAENACLVAKCDSLELRLDAAVKYCDELSLKLKEQIDAGILIKSFYVKELFPACELEQLLRSLV